MSEPEKCVCGETDITKHDMATALAHLYGVSIENADDILARAWGSEDVDDEWIEEMARDG